MTCPHLCIASIKVTRSKNGISPFCGSLKKASQSVVPFGFLRESREFFPTKQRDLSNVNITTDYYKIKSGTNRKQLYLNFKNKVVINITSESEFFFTILDPTHQPKSSNRKNSKPTDKRQNGTIKLLPYECTKWDRN